MSRIIFSLSLLLFVGLAFAQVTEVDTLYLEDFESSLDWEIGADFWYGDTLLYWHSDSFKAYDDSSYWCGTYDVGETGYNGYNDGWLQYMDMPEVSITASPNGPVLLTFMQLLTCEPSDPEGDYPFGYDGWDGSNVWLSTDGGATWDVIYPVSAAPQYDVESAWGFGFCGLGTGYPAWTGTHGVEVDTTIDTTVTPNDTTIETNYAYEKVTFNLTSYAGNDVVIRFAFSSDMMYCTGPTHDEEQFDSTFFGWIVDDIAVFDTTDTFLYDDGSGSPTFSQGRVKQTWELTEETANSPTHSIMTKAYSEGYMYMISPMIHLPDTFLGRVYYYVNCEFVDSDPDTDNILNDYFVLSIIDSTLDTTFQLLHNYYRDDLCDTIWRLADEKSLFATDKYTLTNSLRDFAGHDIRLLIYSRTDGIMDTTQHLYIDDVMITGNFVPMHDIALTELVSAPLNLNERTRFTTKVVNRGMSNESLISINGTVSGPSGVDTMIFVPKPTIPGGGYSTAFIPNWTPQEEGTYTVRAWSSLTTDSDRSNDTIEVEFEVGPASVRELGWDDGMRDSYISETHYFGYLHGGDMVGDGIGVLFYQTGGLTDIELTHIKFYTSYNGDAKVFVINTPPGGYSAFPNGGTVIYEDVHTIASDSFYGSWVTIDLSTDPIDLPDTTFCVFVGPAADSFAPSIGIDNTPLVDKFVFAIVDTGGGKDTMALRDYPPFDVDLLFRTVITGVAGIGEDKPGLPTELALRDNYPDPFNPTTAIGFDIPTNGKVELVVYNLLGERVTTLVDDELKAGTYRVTWNGRDERGRNLPSGVYLYRLTAGDKQLSKKMVLIK